MLQVVLKILMSENKFLKIISGEIDFIAFLLLFHLYSTFLLYCFVSEQELHSNLLNS